MWLLLFILVAGAALRAESAGAGAARLVCYVEGGNADFSECTHLVYAGDARGDKLDGLLRDYRKSNPRLKIILRATEIDKDLRTLLKSKNVQGLELYDAHRTLNRTKVLEMVDSARSVISTSGGGPLFLALPAHPELLAKYYDLRELVKKTDLMIVQTHALGLVKKMTYHSSRLSGLWDMMNTDSVVDLVIGLGVPASKIVVSLPATARQFSLLNETLSTPGSPTAEEEPKEIDQSELCRQLQRGRWTLERDQDLSAPYAFKDKTWISFEDSSSVDVKGKYARVRGLAGLALHKADKDIETPCGPTLRASLAKVLNQQSRAPRAAVLRSLENEILSAPGQRPLDALQVSPYRITQVVDSDGVIHSIREDTRTEFSCSRQGYFVHPRSCARFYRCVKFDQYSPDYTVFEFDCPTGLAFDSRYEVCVWPGSLPNSQACPGTSEIAPVPRTRFICPDVEGFYVDPENCRWFFACLDHGKAPLTAYEFRCPFGLGFDAARLQCDWPWLVPGCGEIGRYEAEAYGFSGATLTGALGFQGKTADSVNVAAHQSLVSGASLDNLVGIQGGFLTRGDGIDGNFITTDELVGGASNDYVLTNDASSLVESRVKFENGEALAGGSNLGLTNSEGVYTSGSLILDDYRLPSASQTNTQTAAPESYAQSARFTSSIQKNTGKYDGRYNTGKYNPQRYSGGSFNDGKYRPSNTGKYVHDPTGDKALPYNHISSPAVPYKHVNYGYTVANDFDVGKYNGSWSYNQDGDKQSGGYHYDKPAGPPFEEGGYGTGYTGTYTVDGYVGSHDTGAYDGGHTLTAGAINVGLVGKTSLVDVGYTEQEGYGHTGQAYFSQPGVTINHVGTDHRNTNGYGFGTTPTSSGVPTNATPFVVTTALPTVTTYKTTFVPLAPKTSVKQIFGFTPTPVTFVTPKVEVINYNLNTYEGEKGTTGYDYARPSIKFEEGFAHTTAAPAVLVSQGFGHQQQTLHVASGAAELTPVTEQPFRKVVAYTTGAPVSTYSQQTINTVEAGNAYGAVGSGSIDYKEDSAVTFVQPQTVVQVTQTLPTVSIQPAVSTYQPHAFSQQTIHKVDASRINAFAHNEGGSYHYTNPDYVDTQKTVIQYTTPTPIVTSTYRPNAFSQQNIRKFVSSTVRPITYQSTPVTLYENPILKFVQKSTPQTFVSSTYVPTFSHQTIHRGSNVKASGNAGYDYTNSGATYNQPQTVIEVSTVQPAIAVQPIVSTYQPQSYSQQTYHKVDAGQVNTYTHDASLGGHYITQPIVNLGESKTIIESSTAVPIVTSTYRPQTFRQRVQTQQLIPVSSTPLPRVELTYQQPAVSVYENPILKYSQKITPVSYVQPTVTVLTQTVRPLVQQVVQQAQGYDNLNVQVNQGGYTYSQTDAQANTGSTKTAYSDASAVSHQEFHQNTGNTQYESGKDIVYVSTTPSTLVYEDHYTTKDLSNGAQVYKAPEYIPPKEEQTYTVPTASTSIEYQQGSTLYKTQDQNDYNPDGYSQQYDVSQTLPQVTVSQTTVELPRRTQFKQTVYQAPEIQVGYKGDEYLPPVVSTVAPIVTSTYSPPTYSTVATSREYLPAKTTYEYNAPEYLPPQTTPKPTTQSREYLPPVGQSFESKFKNIPYQDFSVPQVSTTVVSSTSAPVYRKQNIVVENAKSQLLGFETVGTDAGLIAPVSYTTGSPIVVSSTDGYFTPAKTVTSTYAPELVEISTAAPRRSRPKYSRPITSTTSAPSYQYFESTTYKAPEYLPPVEVSQNVEAVGVSNADTSYTLNVNPYQEPAVPLHRKQNIVVETAKSNLLGFGTVGPDAGLVSYTTASPVSGTYRTVTSTYAPIEEELVVTPSLVPVRRTKPKVAVVTKINDFNPLLVRKLGAVCSCQSPVLVLKGRRPAVKQQEAEYTDYDSVSQTRIQTPVATTVVTPTPIVTSTVNPIIVPDDSFYQDYQEASNNHIEVISNGENTGTYASSTPAVISTTEKLIRIRPRVKTVTVAPTYRTVLLNQEVSPTVEIQHVETATDSQTFDRYGPGGWRGKDETLQGSVDCQRAGLFRHPKQCNKFYACRWDCTKQRFTLHVFNCPVQLSFDPNLGACNWPSQGPACQGDTLLTNTL